MAEKGIVMERKDNLAVIKLKRQEACAKCRACVAGMSEQEMIMEAENACNAQVGDWVELELVGNSFLEAVLIMYGIPCVCFFVGLLGGYFWLMPTFFPDVNPDLPSFLLGLVLTVAAYGIIRTQEHRFENKRFRPIAARLTTPDPEE